ncbi:hypothetical protein PybrP1_008825 [[Pythium] brassicae (nom. inval.)]|nr:hypothetical protein PybrP1_008825 [[Pythium] brassicae (nom. inval.)]
MEMMLERFFPGTGGAARATKRKSVYLTGKTKENPACIPPGDSFGNKYQLALVIKTTQAKDKSIAEANKDKLQGFGKRLRNEVDALQNHKNV